MGFVGRYEFDANWQKASLALDLKRRKNWTHSFLPYTQTSSIYTEVNPLGDTIIGNGHRRASFWKKLA
jgi:hypothetical protein